MNTRKPTSNEIIRSLMAVGFKVVGEKDKQTILKKGFQRLYIPQGVISSEKEKDIQQQLRPLLCHHLNIPPDENIDKVRNWIAAPAK